VILILPYRKAIFNKIKETLEFAGYGGGENFPFFAHQNMLPFQTSSNLSIGSICFD